MENKKAKNIVIIAFSSVFTLIVVSFFYFYFFYLPLISNKELFPDSESKIYLKEIIEEETKRDHGVTLEEIEKKDKVYFIDAREKEEYNILKIKNSVHLRALDMLDVEDITKALEITHEEFIDSLVVIYCHDGHRGSELVSRINLPNVKFLIGGRINFIDMDPSLVEGDIYESPFPNHIQNHDFTVSLEKAGELFERRAFLIDGRLYDNDVVFSSAYEFRIGQLSTKKYNEKIAKILEQKENQVIFVANSYPDLFYIKLLVYRLERDYGFNYRKFHVIFGQDLAFFKLTQEKI